MYDFSKGNGRISRILAATFSLFAIWLLLTSAYAREAGEAKRSTNSISFEASQFQDCLENYLATVSAKVVDYAGYSQANSFCAERLYSEYYLTDFVVRRDKLIGQSQQNSVVLWMVVAITISGVILSALQLLISYRLAVKRDGQLADNTELSVEAGRISLKSSITGLAILSISLAFFFVYVKWVYTITECEIGPDQASAATKQAETHSSNPTAVVPKEIPPATAVR